MDFTTTPPSPLLFGQSPDFYESIMEGCFRRELITMETLRGYVDLGTSTRYFSVTVENGQGTEIELKNIELGDSFLGIELPMRTTKFRNALKKQGIESVKDNGGIDLPGHGVSFYIYEGETATILWSLKDQASPSAEQA